MGGHYIGLMELCDRTGLAEGFLRRLADAGELPMLKVGRRRMFDPEIVQDVLAARAANEAKAVREKIATDEWCSAPPPSPGAQEERRG